VAEYFAGQRVDAQILAEITGLVVKAHP
jgi:hypothetical protein